MASLEPGREKDLPAEAMIVDQVPEPNGLTRTRILSGAKPDTAAQSIAPTLEDGYLWLVGEVTPA